MISPNNLFRNLPVLMLMMASSASPSVLWPPINKMVPVTINYSVIDECDSLATCILMLRAQVGELKSAAESADEAS
jgi:hypothetical protein